MTRSPPVQLTVLLVLMTARPLAAVQQTLPTPSNPRPTWRAAEAWTVASTPSASVGSVHDLREGFERIVDLEPLADGGAIVADARGVVRLLGDRGQEIGRFGRPGRGPGEFADLAAAFADASGDSIIAYDFAASRVTVFSTAGAPIRTVRLEAPAGLVGRAELVGVLATGAWLVGVTTNAAGRREDYQVWTYHADGRPGARVAVLGGGLIGGAESETVTAEIRLPWGGRAWATARGDWVAAGHSDDYRVVLGQAATLTATAVRPVAPRRLDPAVLDAFIREFVRRLPREDAKQAEVITQAIRAAPRPRALPQFERLLRGPQGELWVGRFFVPEDPSRDWDVFDRTGSFLGTVSVPASVDVRVIGLDHVWAIVRDELGVEFVQRFALRKPARRP